MLSLVQLRRWGTCLLVGLLSVALAAPTSAAPKANLKQVEAQVEALQEQAADAAEEWNSARDQLAAVQVKIDSLQRKSKSQESQYEALSADLGSLVRGLYKTGGIDLDLQAMVATDPSAFLAHLDAIGIVGTRQQTALRRIVAAHTDLKQTNAQLRAQQAKATKFARAANVHLKTVNSKLAEAERLLNTLQAADRKKRAAALAAKRKAQAAAAKNLTKTVTKVSSKRVRVVLGYALGKVGRRYTAGGTGPGAYDCSGLTMMAFRQAGVSLSHFSGAQWTQTRRVSRANLQPGDLVFFFRGIRHVGIYIGNNNFVHAASYRYGVIVSSLSESYYAARLTGFGRVGG